MTATADALSALGRAADASVTQRAADAVTGWLARRTSRRGFLVRAGVVGSAMAVDSLGFVLKPQSAYASVCGPGNSCSSGWTVFCATINNGVNACPPGSIAAGWWKADYASLCGGKARYIVDCNATCSKCGGAGGTGICARSCWSCSCQCGPSSSCDQRKTCCNAFRYGQCHQEVAQVGGVTCRVVSCTPPWKWESCSTAPATDNNTRNHNSAQLPTAYTAITARYIRLGENGSKLGATVYGELSVPGGRAQRYVNGRISASAATGAHEMIGPIATRFVDVGAEAGPLGFPVTGTVVTSSQGLVNRFQRGRISSRPDVGTFVLRGDIATRYAAAGGEDGPLGFPTADSVATSDSRGAFAPFEHGRASQLGNGEVLLTHDVLADAYVRSGAEVGPLGFPNGPEQVIPGGRGQTFENGRISYSPATGAHWLSRAIAAKYVELGAESSSLGFPTQDEADATAWPWKSSSNPEIRTMLFEHGSITHEVFSGRVVVQQNP